MNEHFHEPRDFLDFLEVLFVDRSMDVYGDRLPATAHMLQTAAYAANADAADALVAACLLHDIGHLVIKMSPADVEEEGDGDNQHDVVGAKFLEPFFGEDVTRPIALHVEAKRYLCARQPDYFSSLSIGSVRSLELQGGPMSASEAARFEDLPGCQAAVALRRWDEYSKVPGLEVPEFDRYRPLLARLLEPRPEA